MKYYLVGGAVRDRLLNRPVKDRDWVVVGATPEDMQQYGFRSVGKDFPVFLHPDTQEEYALARTERKTAKGYHGFQFHAAADVTLAEDLARRDLTINAIAEDTDGQLIDPYHGQRDIEQRALRHVSPAFAEDPVRILRIARFSARFAELGFTIADETLQLMRDMVAAGEVDALVPERVWQETIRALGEQTPARFFEVLRDCGALKVLFPSVDRLFGVPQRAEYHPEIDTGVHTMMVLTQAAQLSEDTEIRFAALVHDLGKGTTPQDELPRHHGHEQRSRDLVTALCEQYRVPNALRQTAEHVAEHHGRIHRAFELTPKSLLKLLNSTDAFRKPERFGKILTACIADARGRTGFEERAYPQANYCADILKVCQDVDVQAIVAAGHKGERIREELHRQRINAIKYYVHTHRNATKSGQT